MNNKAPYKYSASELQGLKRYTEDFKVSQK